MLLLAQEESKRLIEFSWAPLTEEHGIPMAIMGIVVVFSALVLIVVFITVLPRLVAPFIQPELAPQAASPVVHDDELPEEILVVIAAAVAEALDRPHRIVKIRGLGTGEYAWSLEGRMKHHMSHRIQHRDPK
ncbi:Oxaloacetate decarboxylase, gamma chain [Stieleria neptunia]|uniref:Oxaloacetate decarboxylase, gamma chain n=1 Tax=Stieleria neptunia TaxID=2527979 RepID=A0A518HKT9_9BACT|nr:OadG family protein [Stieleria neptunia]QDV41455.1 Oxaloacetate decarboxylase, gamma chain [Stieleria neptunia]